MQHESGSGYTAPKIIEVQDLAGMLGLRVTSRVVGHAGAVLN